MPDIVLTYEEKKAAWAELVTGPYEVVDDGLNCQIEHPEFGLVPFTARTTDIEEHGRMIHEVISERMAG